MKDKPYVVALYTRMSKEDDDVGLFGNKEESNSITNQRMLLYDFLNTHPEFRAMRSWSFAMMVSAESAWIVRSSMK